MSDEQVTSVARINEALMQVMTGLLVDVTFARIGCEKRDTAAERLTRQAARNQAASRNDPLTFPSRLKVSGQRVILPFTNSTKSGVT